MIDKVYDMENEDDIASFAEYLEMNERNACYV